MTTARKFAEKTAPFFAVHTDTYTYLKGKSYSEIVDEIERVAQYLYDKIVDEPVDESDYFIATSTGGVEVSKVWNSGDVEINFHIGSVETEIWQGKFVNLYSDELD